MVDARLAAFRGIPCEHWEDSIEHYAVCCRFTDFCSRHTGLCPPPSSRRLECFLNFGRSELARRDLHSEETASLARGLAVYALYRVHAAVRLGNLSRSAALGALPPMLREGA